MKVHCKRPRGVISIVAFVAIAAEAMAQGPAGVPCPCIVGCPTGPQVGCAPRRITYGYYPTHWRRWPDAHLLGAPTPAEQVPTPANELPPPGGQETGPRMEPEQPGTTEGTQTPSTTEPGAPPRLEPETEAPGAQPHLEPEPGLPFGEESPAPPSDLQPGAMPSQPGLPGAAPPTPVPGLPGLEPQIQPPPADDAPPAMPAEDPFKDDPIESTPGGATTPAPEATPPAAPTSSENDDAPPAPVAEVLEPSHQNSWRGAGKKKAVEQVAIAPIAEPKLLPEAPATVESPAPRPVSAAEPSMALNPLRGSRPGKAPAPVVAAATWSTDRPAVSTMHLQTRRNPLRGK